MLSGLVWLCVRFGLQSHGVRDMSPVMSQVEAERRAFGLFLLDLQHLCYQLPLKR